MRRTYQTIWPVLAMLISFAALFALTWLFASDQRTPETTEPEPPVAVPAPTTETPTPTPTPPSGELVVIVLGHERAHGDWPGASPGASLDPTPVVDGVLERRGERLCLTESFARTWRPEDEQGWDLGSPIQCRDWPTGLPLDLRFVQR